MKKATIFNRIISHETTSVEIISVLGRELYIYNGIYWTDVLNKFGFSYTPEAVLALKFWKAKQNTEKLSIQLRKN